MRARNNTPILDRSPEEIDHLISGILLDIENEFVRANQSRNFELWEAGVETLNTIGKALR